MCILAPIQVANRLSNGFRRLIRTAMSNSTFSNLEEFTVPHDHSTLVAHLDRVPAVTHVAKGTLDKGHWWIKFDIDIVHKLAWHIVQEFGHVLNYLSVDERLPCMPVSPPPYMNGEPAEFLSWVIESTESDFKPAKAAKWLEGRLPRPVHDESKWPLDDRT